MDIDVDFASSSSWGPDMHQRMRWLRTNDPVYWSQKSELWILSTFDDIAYVSKHQELFTSEHGVRPGIPTKLGLIDEAEPRHNRLRSLVGQGFSPQMVRRLEATFRRLTTETLNEVAALGACDFVQDIAAPLPLLLIAEMIGIRKADWDRFHRWSDAMLAADGNFDHPAIMETARAAFQEYKEYVTDIIEDRRANPQNDLVTILAGASEDGVLRNFSIDPAWLPEPSGDGRLELANDELVMLLALLLVAGSETTRSALSGGMQLLIEHPQIRNRLSMNPQLIPGAVEEMIRLVSPVRGFSRTVTTDTQIQGKRLHEGDRVLMLYSSANRDEQIFDRPDEFRIDRHPQHLGFGIGTHFCLGANLARMELRIAFEEILRRLPDMTYSGDDPTFVPSGLVHSCQEMRVRFTPQSEPKP